MLARFALALVLFCVAAIERAAAAGGCSGDDPSPWPWKSEADGQWGEDPRTTPDFGYAQERRAPKMPDADRYLAGLGPAHVQAVDDGLLICHAEIYSRNRSEPILYHYKLGAPPKSRPRCLEDWDLFGPPDALVRIRVGDAYPITLFGPEDHWGFFFSVPRVSLRAGDRVAFKLWDRDAGSILTSPKPSSSRNDYIGEASLVFDGKLPFTVRTPYFTLRCQMMTAAAAHARARPWVAALERKIHDAEEWRPDPEQWDFGWAQSEHALLASFGYGRGNFRYPAGLLGWDDPEIQARLARFAALRERDAAKRRQAAAALIARAQPLAGEHALPGGGVLRVVEASCADECSLVLELPAPIAAALLSPPKGKKPALALGHLDETGVFTPLALEAVSPTRLDAKLPASARVLWIGGAKKALVLKAPR